LCNKRDITQGLDSKYSIYHSAAVGLVRGKAGLKEYTDEAANDPSIRSVRERVTAVGDPSITEDQSHIDVELSDGRTISRFVEQSLGNIKRPLSDKQLEEKLRDQAEPVLSKTRVDELIELCWRLDTLENVNDLVKATV
jgi:2-methylcitrate dehydratase PrpD